PLATLRLRQAGYGLCSGPVSQSRASPFSSRALPGTQLDRKKQRQVTLNVMSKKELTTNPFCLTVM
ncbi:MAG: hypothetical protein LWX01_04595, partial [Deltaproteobacteria bacterium]|nr:hypothetical protein [Deltaproteobacteria bacterium]MDL1960967.1 hypothetical protein [Deltaproteobacteria bacterium]